MGVREVVPIVARSPAALLGVVCHAGSAADSLPNMLLNRDMFIKLDILPDRSELRPSHDMSVNALS